MQEKLNHRRKRLADAVKAWLGGAQRSRARRAAMPAAPAAEPGTPDDHRYCLRCGHTGAPQSNTQGSIWIELVLWLCLIVPGLIYSIWRHNKRHDVCAKCGSAELIQPDAPIAVAARQAA